MLVYSRSGHKLSFIRIYLHLFFFIRNLIFSCICCFLLCNFSLVCNISTQVSPGRLSVQKHYRVKNTLQEYNFLTILLHRCETSVLRRNIGMILFQLIHRLNLRNYVSVKDDEIVRNLLQFRNMKFRTFY